MLRSCMPMVWAQWEGREEIPSGREANNKTCLSYSTFKVYHPFPYILSNLDLKFMWCGMRLVFLIPELALFPCQCADCEGRWLVNFRKIVKTSWALAFLGGSLIYYLFYKQLHNVQRNETWTDLLNFLVKQDCSLIHEIGRLVQICVPQSWLHIRLTKGAFRPTCVRELCPEFLI